MSYGSARPAELFGRDQEPLGAAAHTAAEHPGRALGVLSGGGGHPLTVLLPTLAGGHQWGPFVSTGAQLCPPAAGLGEVRGTGQQREGLDLVDAPELRPGEGALLLGTVWECQPHEGRQLLVIHGTVRTNTHTHTHSCARTCEHGGCNVETCLVSGQTQEGEG